MITNRTHGSYTWIDLHSPTKEEIESLISTKHVDPIIAKDLLTPTPKQYLRVSQGHLYSVIHIPFFKHTHDTSLEQEIDFVINEDNLVTTRYESIDALHFFGKQLETEEILHNNKEERGHVFFALMRDVYKFLFDEIDYLRDSTKHIEKNIFEGKEKEMVFGISHAARNVLNFKRIIYPHKLVWINLSKHGGELFGESFKKEADSLINDWERLTLELDHVSNMVDELRDTNNSILSTKQNETMKIFTILAFVTFPLSLIASIFGMNSEHMPIIGKAQDFWIIIAIMFFLSLAMFGYFKYKKWI